MGCIRSVTIREGDWDDPVRLAVIVTGSIIADRGNTAHGITEGKQKALFLIRIGQTMYLKLKTWVSPKKLSDLKSQTSAATVEILSRAISLFSASKETAKVL